MKTVKAILAGKGLPRGGEKGFTLVELLIVLAILAVLAAIVIPNVTGMLGRGQKQSFETDAKTIQAGVMAYMIDIRTDIDPDPDEPGHYIPVLGHTTPNGYPGIKQTDRTRLYKINLAAAPSTTFKEAFEIKDVQPWEPVGGVWDTAEPYTTGVGSVQVACAIQMPWLVQKGGGEVGYEDDPGPYLDDNPDSAGLDNAVVPGTEGSYTWICDYSGAIYCVYYDTGTTKYYAGFCDTYP